MRHLSIVQHYAGPGKENRRSMTDYCSPYTGTVSVGGVTFLQHVPIETILGGMRICANQFGRFIFIEAQIGFYEWIKEAVTRPIVIDPTILA